MGNCVSDKSGTENKKKQQPNTDAAPSGNIDVEGRSNGINNDNSQSQQQLQDKIDNDNHHNQDGGDGNHDGRHSHHNNERGH